MALDLNAIKAKLNSLQNTGNKSAYLFKPELGKTTVRILPYKHNPDYPFIEMQFYYEFGNKTYVSPASYGEHDPIIDFANEISNTGKTQEEKKANWILAKKVSPTLRPFAVVLVRGKEKEGPKFWGFNQTIYKELLGFISDPDWGDITDLENGRDIVIEVTPPAAGKKYPNITVRPKPSTSTATTDSDVLDKIESMPKVEELFKAATADELRRALEAYLSGDDVSSDSTEKDEKDDLPFATPGKSPAANSPNLDDVEKQFDDLFKK